MRGRWSWLLIASIGFARPAHAEDKAAAEILFDEGKRLLAEGKLEQACPKLAESQKLDPGVGTLLYLAECYERAGKTASAWATWREAVALASNSNQAQRAKVAREHAEKLEPRLIRIQIDVPADSDLPSLSVSRNGASLARPLWGSAIPVDPGPVEVVASAPGRISWKTTVQAASAGTLVLRVPPLPAEGDAPKVTPPPATAAPSAAPTAPPPATSTAAPLRLEPPTGDGSPRKTAALVVGGVGLLGLAAGSYFGLKTFSTWDDAKGHCTGNICDGEANKLSKQAVTSGTLSTVFFVVGAVGLGVGAGLWFTAPSATAERSARLAPAVGPGLAGMSLSGRF